MSEQQDSYIQDSQVSKYYLRVEGVNFSDFILDTNDLSTRRGGSLLLLDAAKEVQSTFELAPISTGASIGLFEFEANDAIAAAELRRDVEKHFATHDQYRFASMMVDVIEAGSEFQQDMENLIAMNRWRQVQSLRVKLPSTGKSTGPCEIDHARPAKRSIRKGDKEVAVSDSVFVRRKYGVEKKQQFYRSALGVLGDPQKQETAKDMKFVNDLDQLTNDEAEGLKKGNLHHKMAVIHIDGNRFGMIKSANSDTPDALRVWDTYIRQRRAEFLSELLTRLKIDANWDSSVGYRLETLIWGGDEIVLVVPAWKGLETLALFYECSNKWQYKGEDLTHSAGLVFCHHNAPINRMAILADKLVNIAKCKTGDSGNFVAYQILESFDNIGGDIGDFRKKQVPGPVRPDMLLLNGDKLSELVKIDTSALDELLSRKKLYGAVDLAMTKETEKQLESISASLYNNATSKAQPMLDTLEQVCGDGFTRWIHLNNLWDYMRREETRDAIST